MTTSQWIHDLEKALTEAKKQDARLTAGVRSAAPRVRKNLKEVSDLCRSGRQDALSRGKAIPKKAVKPNKKKPAEPTNVPTDAAEPVKAAA